MSIQAIAWALGRDVRPAAAKLLLIALANYANDRGIAWPSKSTLAKDCSMDKSSICRHLQALQDAGLVKIEERTQDGVSLTSLVTIIFDAETAPSDPQEDDGENAGGSRTSATGGDATGSRASATGVVAPVRQGVVAPVRHKPSLRTITEPTQGASAGANYWQQQLNPQADYGVSLTDDGRVILVNGTRADWLAKFGGDATALDLALGELSVQPHSREGLRKQVERQLSRIARMRHDSDQRYRQAKPTPKAVAEPAAHRVSPDTVRYAKPKLERQPWEVA